ncbi:MAG TPA: hypothetical protein VFK43_12905, partial [Acidimicrobiales bacterium]|nr:hypothetical protein [Acidimicrobiales bacterium]
WLQEEPTPIEPGEPLETFLATVMLRAHLDRLPAGERAGFVRRVAERLAGLVAGAWAVFEDVVKASPAELRKGPRGGGRDRDKMVAHVVEAENAYFRKVGVKEGRDAFLEGLRAARQPEPELAIKSWPWRYTARRVAWHVLDHAWEMQDRSP